MNISRVYNKLAVDDSSMFVVGPYHPVLSAIVNNHVPSLAEKLFGVNNVDRFLTYRS